MPRACTICVHPDREAIDRTLVAGKLSMRRIVEIFPGVSETSLRRHREDHVPATLVVARKAEDVAESGDLLDEVRTLRARALGILNAAEDAGDLRTALAAIREVRSCIELLLEVEGELARAPVVTIAINAEWIAIRTTVLASLEPFPAARQAVATELQRINLGQES